VSRRSLPLDQLFLRHQRIMKAALEGDRATLHHPTAKGDAAELHWVEMLGSHLPRRYQVDRAFVVDHDGATSEQIDVVIFDHQYSPVLRSDREAIYVPAESVYAVFEVKQDLSRRSLRAAAQKAASVRRLQRTSARVHHAGGTFEPKPLHRIIGGLLSLGSTWSPPFGSSFLQTVEELSQEGSLECGCALDCGAWRMFRGEDGPAKVSSSSSQTALISFFFDLLRLLQAIATVPAIDFDRYAGGLLRVEETSG
jgi:Domain of unknown function (DUF6602)